MSKPVFTTIFRGTVVWEVRLLQQKLKSEGIEAFVDGENITAIRPHLSHVDGGVGLRVYTEDAERAVDILQYLQHKQTNDPICIGKCPKCDSTKIMRISWPQGIAILAVLLIGIPYLFCSRRKCKNCGQIWWE